MFWSVIQIRRPSNKRKHYDALRAAMASDCLRALTQTSWGLFGLTGRNAGRIGMPADVWVSAIMDSETEQIRSLVRLCEVQSAPFLCTRMREKNWAGLADWWDDNDPTLAGKFKEAYQKIVTK